MSNSHKMVLGTMRRLRDENGVADDGQDQDLEEEFNEDQDQEQVFNEEQDQ